MHPCHVCRRHVRSDASVCPFCHAVVRHDLAPTPRLAGVLLGLAMMSCGTDDGATDDNATTAMTSTMSTTESTSTGTGTSTTNDDNGVSVAAYGDPSFDDSSISEPPETSFADSSTTGLDTSGTSSGSSESTDTGDSSSTTNASDTADYGGPSTG